MFIAIRDRLRNLERTARRRHAQPERTKPTGTWLCRRTVALVPLALVLSTAVSSSAWASGSYFLNGFSELAGGWNPDRYPRVMADVDGDGIDDVVGFGYRGVYVSRSTGTSFESPRLWIRNFAYGAGSWRVDRHPRMMVDMNDDGRADIVGFGHYGVYVALSTGSSFATPRRWISAFGYGAGGWRVDRHPRMVVDMNDDGLPDVVGFGDSGVWVSLSTGTSLRAPQRWIAAYGYKQGGWRVDSSPRHLADVNRDGLPDVVGFGSAGAWVSLSTGHSFEPPRLWVAAYGYSAGGWRVGYHPRFLADVDGDGRSDVVGFANAGVYVSLSDGESFGQPRLWIPEFGYSAGGWRVGSHPRMVEDVNGDGRADVVGFASDGVLVAYSDGHWFGPVQRWTKRYGYNAGWRTNPHIRTLAQMDSDPRPEIVAFGFLGVEVFDDAVRSTLIGQSSDDIGVGGWKYGYAVQPELEPPIVLESGTEARPGGLWHFSFEDPNPELVRFVFHWQPADCDGATCTRTMYYDERKLDPSEVDEDGNPFFRYLGDSPYGKPGEYRVWMGAIAGPTYEGHRWAVSEKKTMTVCAAHPGGTFGSGCAPPPPPPEIRTRSLKMERQEPLAGTFWYKGGWAIRDATITEVRVRNKIDPMEVHFVKHGFWAPYDCDDPDATIVVPDGGATSSGADVRAIFGSNPPAAPSEILACAATEPGVDLPWFYLEIDYYKE